MNKNDSERLEFILCGMGLESTDDPVKASVILLNSCSVRESAENRVFGQARNFIKLKEKNPNLIICITGCMPGRDKSGALEKKFGEVDLFFPTAQMINLPQWLSGLNPELGGMESIEDNYLNLRPNYQSKFQAFITIQTGCDHFCTYCVVPHARGTGGNRSVGSILDEVKELAGNGCLEITLLGQIVNHYKAPDSECFSFANPYKVNDFAKLLWEVNQIKGIERVHWTASHPVYVDEEVLDAMNLPKQINFLHLPVQSGNDEILKKMNRGHDRSFFIDLVKKIKNKKPGIASGTDLIVGFCGETEKQFQDTVDLYKDCDFDISYTAKYSSRSGTAADKAFADDVPVEEKKRRWQVLQNLMEKTTLRKNQVFVEQRVSVLVEKCDNGWCDGHSSEMKLARFKGDSSLVGTIVSVEVYKAEEWILWGRVV